MEVLPHHAAHADLLDRCNGPECPRALASDGGEVTGALERAAAALDAEAARQALLRVEKYWTELEGMLRRRMMDSAGRKGQTS